MILKILKAFGNFAVMVLKFYIKLSVLDWSSSLISMKIEIKKLETQWWNL